MSDIKVAVINACSALTDRQVRVAVKALQAQVDKHFAPAWGIDADLVVVPRGVPPPPRHWWLTLVDHSKHAQVLGLHDLSDEGLPQSKVFAKSDMESGHHWTVTTSHELLEMLVDPDVQLTTFIQTGAHAGTLYAYEICDPCQSDRFAYRIDGIPVSDFLYPSWFEQFRAADPETVFDYRQHIDGPFHLLNGGYIDVYHLGSGGWTQQFPAGTAAVHPAHRTVGPRRQRRRLPRDQWRTSQPRWTRTRSPSRR
jgi:hypothetical protein